MHTHASLLQLKPWNHHCHRYCHRQPPAWKSTKVERRVVVGLSKQGERLLKRIATRTRNSEEEESRGSGSDNNNNNNNNNNRRKRMIKKVVESSKKGVVIDALSHLLSPLSSSTGPRFSSSLALPLYLNIMEASWFEWNVKLAAQVIAFLVKEGQYDDSSALLNDSISRLQFKERDLVLLYCHLIEFHAKYNSAHGFDDSCVRLERFVSCSSSAYVQRQGYKGMIRWLCEMGRPREAENKIEEMRRNGIKPSVFEFRCVLYGYGRLGLFDDMQRIVHQMECEGLTVDTVCSNMILSSYGAHNALYEMVLWLRKMAYLGIPLSSRTWNSVLGSCHTIISILQSSDAYPTSIKELTTILSQDEALLVDELLISTVVFDEVTKWSVKEAKLDLHGMHLSSAYLMVLLWMERTRERISSGEYAIPAEVVVVCGCGNHSIVRGESVVKSMVKEIMIRTRSPMRIDRKNIGCFVGKGNVVEDWLCHKWRVSTPET